jgi:hypothetical protein
MKPEPIPSLWRCPRRLPNLHLTNLNRGLAVHGFDSPWIKIVVRSVAPPPRTADNEQRRLLHFTSSSPAAPLFPPLAAAFHLQ